MAKTTKKEASVAVRQPEQFAIEARIIQTDQSRQDTVPLPPMLQGAVLKEAPGLSPTVEWAQPGEYVLGHYMGSRQVVSPYQSMLHELAHHKTGEVVGTWGGTVLDRKLQVLLAKGDLRKGDLLLIQYTGDLNAKPGQNPARDFRVAVVPDLKAPRAA